MPLFLFQASYTAEAWAAQVKNPKDRIRVIKPIARKLGGKIVHGWLSFGEYDVVGVCEMPDNTSAAAFSIAAGAGGALKALKTTPLITPDEGVEAMKKAAGAGYKPPG